MKLLILDRDGTLNRNRDDYVASPDEWEALPGALEAVARLNQGGWRVVLATNQSGIGRGAFDMAALNAVHAKLHRQLAAVGGRVEAIFFCPHAPQDRCDCRKPAPGLFRHIAQRFGVDLADVPAVGHAVQHVQAAAAAGCPTHWLQSEQAPPADPPAPVQTVPAAPADAQRPAGAHVHADLSAFVDWLLAQEALQAAHPPGTTPS